MKWLAAHTWLMALLPWLVVILLSGYIGKPLDLFKHTEVDYLDRDTLLAMHLSTDGVVREKTVRYEAQLEDGSRILLYLQKDSLAMPKMGDLLLVQTVVSRGGKAGDFDYGMYLRRQGIVGSCWAHRGNWQLVGHKPPTGIRSLASRCQQYLHSQYQRLGIDGKELGILSALTLGYREQLDKDVQRAFSASGAMHVLAVSGLHTGIVWSLVLWILTVGGLCKPLYEERGKRWLMDGMAVVLIWVYAFITGLSPSVMRSALMLSFWALSHLLEQPTSRWNPLLAAAMVILLLNPLALWSVSFQLSFAAVAAIMLLAGKWQSKILLRGALPRYIVGLLLVSVAAQIGTMPLSLYYFGQTSNYFALTNLIVIPMAFVLLILGFCTLAFSWCVLGDYLAVAAKWCTWLLREAVEWIEALPGSTSQLSLSSGSVLALYGAFVCAMLMMRQGKVHWWWLLGVVGCLLVMLNFELRILN